MKKIKWICSVLVAALLASAQGTCAETANNNSNEAVIRAAEKLFEMKMYEQARSVLLKVKESDPSNEKVKELLANTDAKMAVPDQEVSAKPVSAKDLDKVIRNVDFTDARIEEVISYLSAKCDINIVFDEKAKKLIAPETMAAIGQDNEASPVPDDNPKVEESLFADNETGTGTRDIGGITIRLKDVPLKAVLRYVLQMKGLKYIVEDYAIVIVPAGYEPEEEMQTWIYRMYGGTLTGKQAVNPGF